MVEPAISRVDMEAKIAVKPTVQAAVKKLDRYVAFCKVQRLSAFPPTYGSVGEFLLSLVNERKGSTRSLGNDTSHLKTQCQVRQLGWLSYSDDIQF